jgi:glycosyltransferase involved in cell wall biosynthesis
MVKLSVVMSVFNGAAQLAQTLDSIAAQTMTDYELIVIDDGSTDATAEILSERAARDPRIRVITTSNEGLTRALIRGCAEARAMVIARHDCGDVSAPERFARQLEVFGEQASRLHPPGVPPDGPDAPPVLVSCAAQYVGPGGEYLYIATASGDGVRWSLRHDGVDTIRGLPHHGTAMFRRDDYLAAGGYRAEFRFAQDLDLWVRFAKRGSIVILPDVMYTAAYSAGAISATRRDEQVALARIALQLRDDALSDDERAGLIAQASTIGETDLPPRKRDEAAAFYFLASCLRRNRDPRWRGYAKSALRRDPLHLRSWLLLLKR